MPPLLPPLLPLLLLPGEWPTPSRHAAVVAAPPLPAPDGPEAEDRALARARVATREDERNMGTERHDGWLSPSLLRTTRLA